MKEKVYGTIGFGVGTELVFVYQISPDDVDFIWEAILNGELNGGS